MTNLDHKRAREASSAAERHLHQELVDILQGLEELYRQRDEVLLALGMELPRQPRSSPLSVRTPETPAVEKRPKKRAKAKARKGPGRGFWAKYAPLVIDEAGRGLTTTEVHKAVASHPDLRDREITSHAAGVAIYKLQRDGVIIRNGSKLYTEALRKKLGTLPDDEAPSKEGVISGAILSLPRMARGMTSPEIISALRKVPDLDRRLGPKAGQVYNALARFREQGRVLKEGSVYRLSERDEPPGDVPGGPVPGPVNGSRPSPGHNPARTAH
jgi:hypothetical protein